MSVTSTARPSTAVWQQITERLEAARTSEECIDAWAFGIRLDLSIDKRLQLVDAVQETLERIGRSTSQASLPTFP